MTKYLVIALAAASLLTVQLLWNSWLVAQVKLNSQNTMALLDQPSIGSSTKHLSDDYERRFMRLIHKPTNIYVLGERNSGTNYVAGGKASSCGVILSLASNVVSSELTSASTTRSVLQFLSRLLFHRTIRILLGSMNISPRIYQSCCTSICLGITC